MMMKRSALLFRLACLTSLAAVLPASSCNDGIDAIADSGTCSPAAALEACHLDKWKTGSYPAVDNRVTSWMASPPNPLTTLGQTTYDVAPPGCGVGVIYDDEIVYLRGYGSSSLGSDNAPGGNGAAADSPYTLETMGAIGSVSKTITAAALHRLASSGDPSMPSLDDELGDLLPEIDGFLAGVTLRDLLNHSSTVAAPPPNNGLAYYDQEYLSDATMNDVFPGYDRPTIWPRLAYFGMKDNIPQGAVGNYSNYNYRLAGAVIDFYTIGEISDGVSTANKWTVPNFTLDGVADPQNRTPFGYERYIQQGIARLPANDEDDMLTMCLRGSWRLADLPSLAQGYDQQLVGGVPAYVNDTSPGSAGGLRAASGGWMMTIGDLARFVAALGRDEIVDKELLKANPQVIANVGINGNSVVAGEGTWVMTHAFPDGTSAPAIHHLGRVDGYTAYYQLTEGGPDAMPSIGVVMMCNSRVTNSSMFNVVDALIDDVYAEAVAAPGDATALDVTIDESQSGCSAELTALDTLEAEWGILLVDKWNGYLAQAGGDVARAESLARAELSKHSLGRKALALYDAGDIDGAARTLHALLDARTR
jgi:CubicO group peptidase (beta-lactamase class C family)